MNLTRPLGRRFFLALICVSAVLAIAPTLFAEVSSEQASRAGAIPITAELLSKIETFASTVTKDPGTKAEWIASDKDPAMTPDSAAGLIPEKYPKLAAAFKAVDLTPADFIKAYGAIMTSSRLAGTDESVDNKVAQANITFCKANKERIAAAAEAIENLNKSTSSSTPAASAGTSPSR